MTPEQLEATLHARFDEVLEAALAQTGAVREQLRSAHEKTKSAVHAAAGKLAEKHKNALANQNASALRDIERVQLALYPGGEPHERVHGFSYYAARYGERAFIDRVMQALTDTDPFEPAPRDLRP